MSRLLAAAILASISAVPAQTLRLERRPGTEPGSYPGQLGLQMSPESPGLAAVFLSVTPGPIPLILIDPNDNRQFDVGPPFATFSGIFNLQGVYETPILNVPNDPTFLDATIYSQGFILPGTGPTFVGRISNPAPIRFAPTNTFRDRFTQFVTPRAFFPVIETADQRWMMLGGGSGALLAQIAVDSTEIYDPLTDSFVAGPTMTRPRSLHTATRLADGRYLIVGGVDSLNDPQNTAEIYDPIADQFTAVPTMASPRAGHSATLLSNGKVLIAGGLSDLNGAGLDPLYSTLDTTELYDPQANSWSAGPAMRDPRVGQSALTLPDGRVLLIGGVSWFTFIVRIPTILTDCDLYDPATNQITAGPSMGTARAVFPVTDLGGGKVLVSGGLSQISVSNPGAPTDAAEILDTGALQWSNAGQMSQARAMHAVVARDDGTFLCIGGAAGGIFTPIALGTTEVYDPVNGWSAGPPMTMSRAAFGFFCSPLGYFHLLGGASGASAAVDNTTDWYYR